MWRICPDGPFIAQSSGGRGPPAAGVACRDFRSRFRACGLDPAVVAEVVVHRVSLVETWSRSFTKAPRRLSGSRSPAATRLFLCGSGSAQLAGYRSTVGLAAPVGLSLTAPVPQRFPCRSRGHVPHERPDAPAARTSRIAHSPGSSGYFPGAGVKPVLSHQPRRSCLPPGRYKIRFSSHRQNYRSRHLVSGSGSVTNHPR